MFEQMTDTAGKCLLLGSMLLITAIVFYFYGKANERKENAESRRETDAAKRRAI